MVKSTATIHHREVEKSHVLNNQARGTSTGLVRGLGDLRHDDERDTRLLGFVLSLVARTTFIGANAFVAGGERTDERDCTGEEERILTGDNDMGELEGDGAFCGVGMGAAMGIGGGDGFCFNGASDIDRERRERKEQVTNSGRIVSSGAVLCGGCSSSSSSRSISWPFMYITFRRRIGFAEASRLGALLELDARGESRNRGDGGGSPGDATASSLEPFRAEDGWKNGAWPVWAVGGGDGGVSSNGRKANFLALLLLGGGLDGGKYEFRCSDGCCGVYAGDAGGGGGELVGSRGKRPIGTFDKNWDAGLPVYISGN